MCSHTTDECAAVLEDCASAAHARHLCDPVPQVARMGMKSPGCACGYRRACGDLHRLEFLQHPRTGGRILRPRGHMSALRQDASRAPGQGGPTSLPGRALRQPRGLCAAGERGGARAAASALAPARGRDAICRCGSAAGSVPGVGHDQEASDRGEQSWTRH